MRREIERTNEQQKEPSEERIPKSASTLSLVEENNHFRNLLIDLNSPNDKSKEMSEENKMNKRRLSAANSSDLECRPNKKRRIPGDVDSLSISSNNSCKKSIRFKQVKVVRFVKEKRLMLIKEILDPATGHVAETQLLSESVKKKIVSENENETKIIPKSK